MPTRHRARQSRRRPHGSSSAGASSGASPAQAGCKCAAPAGRACCAATNIACALSARLTCPARLSPRSMSLAYLDPGNLESDVQQGDVRAAGHRLGPRPGAGGAERVPALAQPCALREHGGGRDRCGHPGGGRHVDCDQPVVGRARAHLDGLPDHDLRHFLLPHGPEARRALPRGDGGHAHGRDDRLLLHQLVRRTWRSGLPTRGACRRHLLRIRRCAVASKMRRADRAVVVRAQARRWAARAQAPARPRRPVVPRMGRRTGGRHHRRGDHAAQPLPPLGPRALAQGRPRVTAQGARRDMVLADRVRGLAAGRVPHQHGRRRDQLGQVLRGRVRFGHGCGRADG
eukprot:2536806-Prymnesium_polylepis.1